MRWTPRVRRVAVVACLLIPAAVIVMASRSQAQFQPPPQPKFQPPPPIQPPVMPKFQPPPPIQPPVMPKFQPPPPIQPLPPPKFQPPPPIQPQVMPNMPVIQMVWKCSRCNQDMGSGAAPPATCPHCGARIINGQGPANVNPAVNPNPPGPGGQAGVSRGAVLVIIVAAGLLFGAILVAGIGVGVYFVVAKGKKSGRSSSGKRMRRRRSAV
jgi:hypothetical protein